MPRIGNGNSLRTYRVSGWFGPRQGQGENFGPLIIKASTLVGAAGRAAREGRKQLAKGKRYTQVTINVETEDEHETTA
jgi:hypothetical protein